MCQKTVLAVEGIPVSVLCRGRWRGKESTNDNCVGFALFGGKSLKAVSPRLCKEVTVAMMSRRRGHPLCD